MFPQGSGGRRPCSSGPGKGSGGPVVVVASAAEEWFSN